ncbi:SRPBCC family protein [Hyphobacterium marinum]|uniref:SRPBCC domain-containing protein n=1 Tax=Hyphobacterium marinum TaxID=3116574 RepID=A0ABU7M1H8_9PROT|nr:SRPBCC domain-containing protein [Hyphobacterium sp. Y6023]MEE2567674.1 SRPBCC domain-containing protein [Hyphobacterium sp. Y6023]
MMRVLLAAALLITPAAFASAQDTAPGPITATIEIDAPVSEAWELWTTEEGLSFFAPASRIELEPGGIYEVYFLPDAPAGQRGSEGTHVLGFQTERMLTITWGLPPYMPEVRPYLTAITILFEDLGEDRTRVTLTHSGWGWDGEWDAARAYFVTNWPAVLDLMKTAAEGE